MLIGEGTTPCALAPFEPECRTSVPHLRALARLTGFRQRTVSDMIPPVDLAATNMTNIFSVTVRLDSSSELAQLTAEVKVTRYNS